MAKPFKTLQDSTAVQISCVHPLRAATGIYTWYFTSSPIEKQPRTVNMKAINIIASATIIMKAYLYENIVLRAINTLDFYFFQL